MLKEMKENASKPEGGVMTMGSEKQSGITFREQAGQLKNEEGMEMKQVEPVVEV